LTPQFHQDLIDGESSQLLPTEIANAARKKYGSVIQDRIADETKGMYVLAGHVQQLIQKLQRSPFFGIVVQVCASLQSNVVGKETYENDVLPFLNKAQRKDFAVFMKRIRNTRAQHAAAVEQLRIHLEGQKSTLVHYCRQRRIKETGFVSQRELFDILMLAKISANEAKSGILFLDPLVRNRFLLLLLLVVVVVVVVVLSLVMLLLLVVLLLVLLVVVLLLSLLLTCHHRRCRGHRRDHHHHRCHHRHLPLQNTNKIDFPKFLEE